MSEHLHIKLLGQPRIETTDGKLIAIESRKAAGIVYYLSLSKTPLVRRQSLLPLFWYHRSEQQARNSLNVALSDIRKALTLGGHTALVSDRTYVGLDRDRLWIDVREVDRLSRTDSPQCWYAICALYGGELLEGFSIPHQVHFTNWLNTERNAIRSTFSQALEELSRTARDDGALELTMSVAQQMLQSNYIDQAAHRTLMNAYLRQKKVSLAIDQYNACREAILEKQGIAPDEATTRLFQKIREESTDAGVAPSQQGALQRRAEDDGHILLLVNPAPMEHESNRRLNMAFTGEIIAALSRFKWIAVVRGTEDRFPSDHASAALEVRPPVPDYELTWTLRLNGSQVRVLVEILEFQTRRVVWADRFTSEPTGTLLDFDDSLVSKITSSIDGQLRVHELRSVVKKDAGNLGAHEKVLKAINLMHELTEERFREARTYLRDALELDRNYAAAYTWWAFWEIFNIGQGWRIERDGTNLTPRDIALEAIKLDPNDALALVIAGHFDAFIERNLERASEQIEKSLRLNPNSSFALMLGSNTYSYRGEPQRALQMLDRSQELCPIEPYYGWMYNTSRCIAYTFAREYLSAAEWGRRSVRVWPNFSNGYKPLICSLGHLGHREEAQEYLGRLLDLEPDFTVSSFIQNYPFGRESDRDNYAEGLRLAGVRE